MPIQIIVRNCAPTLAGIKIANLFTYRFQTHEDLMDMVWQLGIALNPKGVYVKLLRVRSESALVLVYRKTKMEEMLEDGQIQQFLAKRNYCCFELQACFDQLIQNLGEAIFPHEIGVFLGYPLEDILSFIEHKGQNFKCLGCWKAYHNEDKAQQTFDSYKKCTAIYCRMLMDGFDISRLTIAG